MLNPAQNVRYSVTEIADVLIYSDGEGEPTPEMLVGAAAPEAPDAEPETDAPAGPADTAEPDTDTSDDPTDTTAEGSAADPAETTTAQNAEPPKTGCSSAIGAGLAAITIIVAASAVLALRKRKD